MPDHPGTTTFDQDPARAATLWERPHDLSRVIAALAGNASLAGEVDMKRVAAIGHSLGGWTVSALAGARFEAARFEEDCRKNASPRACALKTELGLGRPEIEGDLSDPRVKAFVSLDLGLARGFMGLCKPGAAELIEKEEPGNGVACLDGGTRSREEIHREIAFLVMGFLATAMPLE